MSDTPETDAAKVIHSPLEGDTWVYVEFAEKLERERNLATYQWQLCIDHAKKLERERDEFRAERDSLRLSSQKEAEHHDKMVGELERLYDQRDELQKKYDTLAAENMLEVHKLCKEQDEARHEIEGWSNKWNCAVEMGARAMVERDEWRKCAYDLHATVMYLMPNLMQQEYGFSGEKKSVLKFEQLAKNCK